MTGKEALKHIMNIDDTHYVNIYDEEFEVIKRDLDALNIVKKYIQQFHLPANEDRVEYIDSISFELSTDALTKEELEDYNKLKEWLKYDK